MYDRILFPYDGSDGADAVLDHAAALAKRCEATVQLVYVADTTRDSVTTVGSTVVDALVDEGSELLDAAARALAAEGVAHETDVVQGTPAPTIVDYAEQFRSDLIVMPTHGRRGVSRYLLGSVTERVVRLSGTPVLTAPLGDEAAADDAPADPPRLEFPYERVLVATDGSAAATRAAEHALDLAALLGAAVHALSVQNDDGLGPDAREVLADAASDAAESAVEAVADSAAERGLETVTAVEHGDPAATIRAYAADHDVDLVAVGTTGRRGLDRVLLGSVTERVVRTVPVPVLSVGDGDGDANGD